jgi:hypothetical protein
MRNRRRGSTLVEFTLVGIPVIFLFTSTMTCAIDMWQLFTLSYAVDQTARYAAVHGSTCSSGSNACTISQSDVAEFFQKQALALDPALTTLVLNDGSGALSCSPITECPSPSDRFPSAGHNSPTGSSPDRVTIQVSYPLLNPIFMFWPGAGSVRAGRFTVGATSTQQVMF